MKILYSYILAASVAFAIAGCSGSESGKTQEETYRLDLSNIDSTAQPADDFFQFVNGGWLRKTEIPGDQGAWGSFNELNETNNKMVLNVLEKAAKSDAYAAGTDQRKAADFYAIGMDSSLAEARGFAPLNQYLEKISAIDNKKNLQEYLTLQLQDFSGGSFFDFEVSPDLKNSNVMTTYLSQGGLGLPDRDYYVKTDSRSKEIRVKYLSHIATTLQLLGDTPASAESQAKHIMTLETKLAEASMTNVEQRDIPALYNKMSVTEISKLVPAIDWKEYLKSTGITNVDTIIVAQPKYMKAFQSVVQSIPVAEWKEYLRWHLVNSASSYLSHDFVQTKFDFYNKELRGVDTMSPRWKRVLATTNASLGEAIGKLYVDATFPPEAKQKAIEMVDNIKQAFSDRIKRLDWMSDSTKAKAQQKLKTMMVKIGYPDEWKSYGALQVDGDSATASYIENVINANRFAWKDQVAKLGKPVDRKEWGMNPQTVNAYYNPSFNEIVFPAAILQPPAYNYKADAAVNYGAIGAIIGHEISHSFDDQGSAFDAEGNMVNWWTDADAKNFNDRTEKLVTQYDAFEPLDSVHVNGALTLGENIGDLGGINAAYDGLQKYLSEHGNPGLIDGLTPEQRFFIAWATVWRTKYKDETLRTRILTDPHSPNMYRANGPLRNLDAFYKAFDVKPGDKMYSPDSTRVAIW